MSEFIKYEEIGSIEVTVKTATVGDIDILTESDIGKLCTLNADGQVGIDATNTTPLGIFGKVLSVNETDGLANVQIGGLAEIACGETVAFGSNRTYLGTYNGLLYVHSAAVVTSGQTVSLIEGGTTSKKAVIKLG